MGCQAPTETFKVADSTINCMLDDCSEWTEDTVVELLDNYQARWDVLRPTQQFFPAKNWYIEAEEDLACRLLPETSFTMPDCGGYSDGDTIHVQGTLDGFLLNVYMAPTSHELSHNTLEASTGDGDSNHSEGDGPWDEDIDLLINVMSRLGCDGWAEFGTPCGEGE